MNRYSIRRKWQPRSRGLAPLEMVLSLPILLFVMALIINFGTVASWKVRGLSAARHAVWSARWSRGSDRSPQPSYWPVTQQCQWSWNSTDWMTALDEDHPEVDLPAARGPVLQYGTIVDRNRLNPAKGPRRGTSAIDRDFPLLAKMGPYHLDTRHHLLDDPWDHNRTGQTWSNSQRRLPALYTFPQTNDAWLRDAYYQAAMNILSAPFREDLSPLDREEDFVYYQLYFGWSSQGAAPNFHPPRGQLRNGFSSLEHSVAQQWVDELILQIQGGTGTDARGKTTSADSVAKDMTNRFISLYRRVVQELEGLINADPPPPAADIAAMQAEINRLNEDIETLIEFRGTL